MFLLFIYKMIKIKPGSALCPFYRKPVHAGYYFERKPSGFIKVLRMTGYIIEFMDLPGETNLYIVI